MDDADVRRRVLGKIQADLQSIYRVDSPFDAADFALTREQHGNHGDEELLVREENGDLEIGLWVNDDVLHEVDSAPDDRWTERKMSAHCLAVEGVSHFLYLTQRASVPRPVSQLELELQAEVDKFATILLALWESGRRESVGPLRSRLFERVTYKPGLTAEVAERYRTANFLASAYCRFLEARYVVRNSVEGLLADLRRMYRLGAGEKLSYAASGGI